MLKIDIYNMHDLTFEDCNEIMKIEDEMKFATVNLNIVEVNNLIVVNSFWNFYVTFFLIPRKTKVTIEFSAKNAIRITYSAFGKIQKVLFCWVV